MSTKLSERSVSETVAVLTSLLAARDIKLFAVIDQAAEARHVGARVSEHHPSHLRQSEGGDTGDASRTVGRSRSTSSRCLWCGRTGSRPSSPITPHSLAARHHLYPALARRLAGIDEPTDVLVAQLARTGANDSPSLHTNLNFLEISPNLPILTFTHDTFARFLQTTHIRTLKHSLHNTHT